MTSFTLAGSSGTNQTISDGNTLTIAAGPGISTSASATDQLTVSLNASLTSLTDVIVTSPVTGQVLKYTGTNWAPGTDDTGAGGGMTSFTLAGDGGTNQTIEQGNTLSILGGTNITTTAGATDEVTVNWSAALGDLSNVSSTAPSTGQVLEWTGSQWAPATDNQGMTFFTLSASSGTAQMISEGNNMTIVAGTGISTTAGASDQVTVALNANIGDLLNVSSTAPSTGQVLKWNGSQWAPGTDDGGGGSISLGDLSDVTLGSLQAGDGIVWNGVAFVSQTVMTNWNAAGDSGSTQIVSGGEIVDLIGGTGISTTVANNSGATNWTVNLDINELTSSLTDPDADMFAYYDNSSSLLRKANLRCAGDFVTMMHTQAGVNVPSSGTGNSYFTVPFWMNGMCLAGVTTGVRGGTGAGTGQVEKNGVSVGSASFAALNDINTSLSSVVNTGDWIEYDVTGITSGAPQGLNVVFYFDCSCQ